MNGLLSSFNFLKDGFNTIFIPWNVLTFSNTKQHWLSSFHIRLGSLLTALLSMSHFYIKHSLILIPALLEFCFCLLPELLVLTCSSMVCVSTLFFSGVIQHTWTFHCSNICTIINIPSFTFGWFSSKHSSFLARLTH